MHQTTNQFVGYRAEALAKEFLTRRQDVAVVPFEQAPLDLFVTIYPQPEDSIRGFLGFGVILKGTDRELPTKEAATQYVNSWWRTQTKKGKERPAYFLPVLLLLFSMQNDQGYYAWVTEPYSGDGIKLPKLKMVDRLDCRKLERDSLDEIVPKVKEWYTHLAPEILLKK